MRRADKLPIGSPLHVFFDFRHFDQNRLILEESLEEVFIATYMAISGFFCQSDEGVYSLEKGE